MSATSQSQNQSDKPSYWNLTLEGFGHVYNIREIKPPHGKGTSSLCCTIVALCGPSDAIEKRTIDVTVVGKDAQHLIKKCLGASNAKSNIFVRFRIGDPYIRTYTKTKGEDAGKPGYCFKGRLLSILMLSIDGVVQYRQPRREEQADPVDDIATESAAESLPESTTQPASQEEALEPF